MTKKKQRFTDNGFEAIEDQSFTDNQTGKTYYVDYFDEIVDLLNALHEENQRLKAHILRYTDCDYEDIQEICKDENLSEWWNDME